MFNRVLGRRIAALVVALGVFLSGTAPVLAMPARIDMTPATGMSMAMDMAMQSGCADMAMAPTSAPSDGAMMNISKSVPDKPMPCKNSDGSCALCAGCAVSIGLLPEIAPANLLSYRQASLIAGDVNPDGHASPPALPPPILRA